MPDKAKGNNRGKKVKIQKLRLIVQIVSFITFVIVVSGAFCTFTAGSIVFVEPLGFFQILAASRFEASLLVVAAGSIVLILVFGLTHRAFCGWVCPIGFIHDIIDRVSRRKTSIRQRSTRYKEVVAVTSICASAISGVPVWCIACPVGAICRGIGLSGVVSPIETALITSLAVAPGIRSQRFFCRNLCPIAGLANLISKVFPRKLRVQVDAKVCTNCKACARVCPMGVDPRNPERDDCILCLKCYEACPKNAISIRFM